MLFTLRTVSGDTIGQFTSFKESLEYAPALVTPAIVSWESIERVCCLDVDDIDGYNCDILCGLIQPVPGFAWVSRSGHGIHAIFEATTQFKADEVAAIAALYLTTRHPTIKTFELLKHTFRPVFNQLKIKPQSVDPTFLSSFLGCRIADEDEIKLWLEARGLVIGERYPHTHCPNSPDEHGERDPVRVFDTGIYCHVCAAKGRGYFSFESLCGVQIPSDLSRMVKAKTHWEHARHVFTAILGIGDRIHEKLYAAMLVHRHGDTHRVFWPRRNLLRINRWWGTDTGELYNQNITSILADLPACQYEVTDIKGKTKLVVDKPKVNLFQQTVNLAEYGYPSVHPIRGIRIYGHYLPYSNKDHSVVFQNSVLAREEHIKSRPRYTVKRDLEYAWSVIERAFPGVCRNAIRLLIAARGTSEGQIGLPSFLFISGQSSAAKTSSILIAAAIVGDHCSTSVWVNNIERVRQSIQTAKDRGSYVCFDEIGKAAERESVEFRAALDDMLTLTPDSLSHAMYIGPVPLGILPVVCWVDTAVPVEIRESMQLARRLVHVHLPERMDWEKSIYQSGVHKIEHLRISGLEFSEACDIILSSVIDDFFQTPQDLKTIAEQLGYSTLAKEAYEDVETTLKEFFECWQSAPPLSESAAKRWRSPGWKLIDLSQASTPIAKLWDSVHDSGNPRESRRCSEANWPKLLNMPGPIEFECQSHGAKVVVRFKGIPNG